MNGSATSAKARVAPPESLVLFQQFRARLDQTLAQAWEQYQAQMQCKAGCFSCCRNDFRISLVEAALLRQAVLALPAGRQAQIRDNLSETQKTGLCPLLLDGQCGVYEERPVLCRIFGFPVSDGETIATCELNFQEFLEQESQEALFSAQCFDSKILAQSLHALSRLFLQETCQTVPSEGEVPPMGTIPELLSGLFAAESSPEQTKTLV